MSLYPTLTSYDGAGWRVGLGEQMTVDGHIRETYAHFGLAVYLAQVLEHGIVNAMVVARLPLRQRFTRNDVDMLMDRQFAHTLGKLIRNLRADINVPPTLEDLLSRALRKRNWLCHTCWREHALNFMKWEGRELMIREFKDAQQLMSEADKALDAVVKPLAERGGITDEIFQRAYDEMCRENGIVI